MARNEEKAQSMLYRFREAQAAELGLGTRSDRRPRMASTCKSLRDCERWRGEILREISRKVSKIQDAGLTDYEVRDLNDEINKLLREKRHWENQIVALGGANYRRNVAMLDDDGKEVPGTKGYKYFGRAKDLPGVRELFQTKKKEDDEQNQAEAYYRKFANQGPAYFGDLDESDGSLLTYERAAEDEEWEDTYEHLRKVLGLSSDDSTPKIPRIAPGNPLPPSQTNGTTTKLADSKRKAPDGDADTEMQDSPPSSDDDPSKRPRTKTHVPPPQGNGTEGGHGGEEAMLAQARTMSAYITFLSPENLLPPKMPTHEEMEQYLLELRKKALVEEYFGE